MHFGTKRNKLHTKNVRMCARVIKSLQFYFVKLHANHCLYSLTTKWCEKRMNKNMSINHEHKVYFVLERLIAFAFSLGFYIKNKSDWKK